MRRFVCVFADSTYSGSDSGSSVTMTLGLTAESGFKLGSTQYGHIVLVLVDWYVNINLQIN